MENHKPLLPALPMKEQKKPPLKDLNNFLMCRLCGGYLVEATSIVECFHTYCRSCIVQFLQNSKFCPVCEVQVNKMKPLSSLRPDKIIQRLVYKTVPGLYKNELERRRKYSQNADDAKVADEDNLLSDEYYFAPDDSIRISLEYFKENRVTDSKNPSSDLKEDHCNSDSMDVCEKVEEKTSYIRYLLCPALVKVGDLHKFIKMKFNLSNKHAVEILYDNVRLPNYFSLMDIAYTFSWTREKPMRLCFQIFERSTIQVPVVIPNNISDETLPMKDSAHLEPCQLPKNLSVDPSTNSRAQINSKLNNNETEGAFRSNFKRKSESTTEVSNLNEECDDKFEFREPSVKIPRIESSKLDVKDKKEEKLPSAKSTNFETNNGASNGSDPTLNSVSSTVPDNFTDYEQDIEEVDEDEEDDDNDDRLCISQLSEEETTEDKQSENSLNLTIDTSDVEKTQEEKFDEKKLKYKRKNKKSRHHHHRKHRHHERKKPAQQATILHSPDTDIMKLKLKLSNYTSDTKHHRQNKRKHKKNSETYLSSVSSSSSVSSVTISSPELISTSRADEDSSHSRTSEFSIDSTETCSSKNDSSMTTPKIENSQSSPSSTTKTPTNKTEIMEKPKDPIVKEKIIHGRNFRRNEPVRSPVPMKLAIGNAKPSSGKEKMMEMRNPRVKNVAMAKPDELDKSVESNAKNDNNNNDKQPLAQSSVKETSEVSVSEIRKSASPFALTVSKITAAEMKKEQEKLQFSSNCSKEEPPALEITVVPAKNVTTVSSSTVNESAPLTVKPNKSPQKSIKPIPAAIPLSQYQKMKSSTEHNLPKLTEHNLPKSLTITPHMTSNPQRNLKLNGDLPPSKKLREVPSMKVDGMKQSITISLSENDSALDLSGSGKQQIMQPFSHNKKVTNGMYLNGIPTRYPSANNGSLNDNLIRSSQRSPEIYTSTKTNNALHSGPIPSKKSMMLPSSTPSILRSQVPMRLNTIKMNNKVHNLPQLNEIKTGPPTKPGPNQNVRSIPNLNTILQRQQMVNSLGALQPDMSLMHRVMSSACSFSNLKKNSDKCPPAVPINKAYLDRSNLMVTK